MSIERLQALLSQWAAPTLFFALVALACWLFMGHDARLDALEERDAPLAEKIGEMNGALNELRSSNQVIEQRTRRMETILMRRAGDPEVP